MRTFIALDLSREAIKEIQGIQKILKKQNLFTGKFTESENLHLTLKFLGEISDDKVEDTGQKSSLDFSPVSSSLTNKSKRLDEIKKRLSEIKLDGFYCEIGEVGVFAKSFIKIIWIKLNGKGIFQLQKEIDDKLKDLFEVEERFMSHLTIARVKHVSNKKDLLEYLESVKPSKLKFYCNKFYFKKSELKPDGPEYKDLEEYALN